MSTFTLTWYKLNFDHYSPFDNGRVFPLKEGKFSSKKIKQPDVLRLFFAQRYAADKLSNTFGHLLHP